MIGASIGGVVALSVKSLADAGEKISTREMKKDAPAAGASTAEPSPAVAVKNDEDVDEDINVNLGPGGGVKITSSDQSTMVHRIAQIARESVTTLLMLPIQILLTSLSSIIIALLYLKTRQAGGENLRDLFNQFEETEHPRKKWQERVRNRLIQSGRITSRP